MGRKKKTAQRNNQGQGAQGGQANQSMALVLSTESYYHSSDVASRGTKRALNSVIVVPEGVPVPVEPEPTAKLAVDMDKLAEYFESTWGEDTEDFQLCLCHSAAALLQFGSMPPDKLVSRLEADGVWHAREGETPEEQADSLIRNLRKDRGLHFDHFPFEGKAYHGSGDSNDSGGFIVLKPGAFPMELRQQLYYGNGIEEPERWIYPVSPSAAVHRNTHRQGRFHQRLRECIDAIWHTADEDTRVRHAVATYLSKVPWAEAPIEDVQVHLDQEGLWPFTFFPEKRICSGTDRDVGRTLRELLASDKCHFSTVAKGHVNLKISQVLISGYVCRLEAVETAEQLAQLQGLPQQQASLLLEGPWHAADGADNDGDVYDNGNDEPKQLEYDGFDGCVDDDTDAEEQQYDQRPNTHHVLSYRQGYDRGFEPYPYPYHQQQQQQPGGMAPRGWGSGQASGYAAAPMHAFPGSASMHLQAGQGSDPWASSRPPRSMQDTACPAAGSGQMLPAWGEAGVPRNVAYRMTFSPHGKPQYAEWDHSLTRQPHEAVLQQGLDRTEQGAGQRGLHHPMHSLRRHADDEVHHGDDATGVHGEDMGMGMGAHADADICMDGVEDAAVMELLHALPRG